MKRYDELVVYERQPDGTLVRVRPVHLSRCPSIELRMMEEAARARQNHGSSSQDLPNSSDES